MQFFCHAKFLSFEWLISLGFLLLEVVSDIVVLFIRLSISSWQISKWHLFWLLLITFFSQLLLEFPLQILLNLYEYWICVKCDLGMTLNIMKIETTSLFSLLDFNQLLKNELLPNIFYFPELKKNISFCVISDEMDTQWKWKGLAMPIVNTKQPAY